MTSITLLGCNNSTDNVTAQDVANRTFIFDSSFIDLDLDGLTAILAFGTPVAANSIPFDLTLKDEVTDDETTLSGTATIRSIALPTGGVEIRDVTLPDPIVFDVNVDLEDDGTLVFTFTNDNRNELRFEFEPGETSADAAVVQ